MKTKIVITSLITGALLLPIAGYSADGSINQYPVLMDSAPDSALGSAVSFKIGSKMSYKTNVHVFADKNGTVFLTGDAQSQAEVAEAESLARSVKGVKSVQSTVQVAPMARVTDSRKYFD